ncbi:MAG: DUF2911 domain-containing protein [Terracidiphilus sp.]
MKRFLVCLTLLAVAAALTAQQTPPKAPPKSPAATESAAFGGKTITITYSSPRVNGRAGHIFTKDGLISHDKTYPVWRAGANAATILQTDADLDVGDPAVRLPKGSYSLYVDISDPDNWVLIVNKQTGQGGLTYDPKQDLVHAKMAMDTPKEPVEDLKYTLASFGGSRDIAKLTLSWENHSASVLFFLK